MLTPDVQTKIMIEQIQKVGSGLHSRDGEQTAPFALLLFVIYLMLGFIGILSHEMWRDELNAWLLAGSSLGRMVHFVRYEGHPILWYLSMFLIRKLTPDLLCVQVFHLLLAAGTVYLVGRYAPFSRMQKILFSFGYFTFYEYAVISRMYALGVLALSAFCALLKRPNRPYLILFSALAVMANVSVYTAIIALSLALGLVAEFFLARRAGRPVGAGTRLLTGLAVFAVAVSISIAQMVPPADGFTGNRPPAELLYFGLKRAINTICIAYLPIPNTELHFWSSSIFANEYPPRAISVLCGLAMFVLFVVGFIRRPLAMVPYVCGTVGIVGFTYWIYQGAIRHYGQLFILLVACLWISRTCFEFPVSNETLKRLDGSFCLCGRALFTLLLVVHLAVGGYAYRMDLFEPFSRCKETAEFIKEKRWGDMPIVGFPDYIAGSLGAWLGRRVYRIEGRRPSTMLDAPLKSHELVCERVAKLASQNGGQMLFVANCRVINTNSQLVMTLVRCFDRSIVADESCYVYLIQLRDSASKALPILPRPKYDAKP